MGAFRTARARCVSSPAVALQVAIWSDRRYPDMSLLKPKEAVVAKAAREANEELHDESVLHIDWDSTLFTWTTPMQ